MPRTRRIEDFDSAETLADRDALVSRDEDKYAMERMTNRYDLAGEDSASESPDMIEDASKNVRTTYRFGVLVGLSYLIFALTLPSTSDVTNLKRAVDDLRAIEIRKYDDFVTSRIEKECGAAIREVRHAVIKCMDDRRVKVVGSKTPGKPGFRLEGFGLGASPPDDANAYHYVGRFIPDDTYFANIEESALTNIEAAMRYPGVSRDVEVFVPDAAKLVDRLDNYFDENLNGLVRLDGWQLGVPDPSVDSFFESPTDRIALSFELRSLDRDGFAPVFAGEIVGTWTTLADSNFRSWLTRECGPEHFVFSSKPFSKHALLADWWDDLLSLPLHEVTTRLQRNIEHRAANDTSISIGGLTIPGPVAIIGVPLVWCALILHLSIGLGHLATLSASNRADLSAFSWAPLNVSVGGELLAATSLALPSILGSSIVGARIFDVRPASTIIAVTLVVFGSVGVAVMATNSLKNLRRLTTIESETPTDDIDEGDAIKTSTASDLDATAEASPRFVSSRNGSLYHVASCRSATMIHADNIVQHHEPPNDKTPHEGCITS